MRRFRHGAWLLGAALLPFALAVQAVWVPMPSARSSTGIPDFDASLVRHLSVSPHLRSSTGVGAGDAVIAPPPETFDAAFGQPAPPPSALDGVARGPQGGTWAVVIGINNYPGSRSDLRSAVNDARDVDEALGRYGVAPHRRLLLTDRQATADVIRRSTQWLAERAAPEATAVFFFAGHVRKLAPGTEALVAADGTLISDQELAALLAPVQASRSWVAIAGCYGGGFDEVLTAGRVLTAAADAHHLAYENSAFGRSYLVEYMVRRAMIGGAASGSVESAFAWAHRELRRDYPDRVPFQLDHDASEIVLGPVAISPASAHASPPPAPSHGSSGSGGGAPGHGAGGAQHPSTPPPPRDTCSRMTLGVVSCD